MPRRPKLSLNCLVARNNKVVHLDTKHYRQPTISQSIQFSNHSNFYPHYPQKKKKKQAVLINLCCSLYSAHYSTPFFFLLVCHLFISFGFPSPFFPTSIPRHHNHQFSIIVDCVKTFQYHPLNIFFLRARAGLYQTHFPTSVPHNTLYRT